MAVVTGKKENPGFQQYETEVLMHRIRIRRCPLYGFEYFAEIFLIALRVPELAFDFKRVAEFEFIVIDVLVAKRAALHWIFHLPF
jgi:hypothetical protein